MQKLKRLWRENRLLSIGFFAAFILTVFLIIRLSISIVFWSYHQDEAPTSDMNLGYIAHSHRVSVWDLKKSIGIKETERDRRTIGEIAKDRGVDPQILLQAINNVIEQSKNQQGK